MGGHDTEDQDTGKKDERQEDATSREVTEEPDEESDDFLMKVVAYRASENGRVPEQGQEAELGAPANESSATTAKQHDNANIAPQEEKSSAKRIANSQGVVAVGIVASSTERQLEAEAAARLSEPRLARRFLDSTMDHVPGAFNVTPGATGRITAGSNTIGRDTSHSDDDEEAPPTSIDEEPAAPRSAPLDAQLVVERPRTARTSALEPEQPLSLHVATAIPDESPKRRREWLPVVGVFVLLAVIVVLVLGITGAFQDSNKDANDVNTEESSNVVETSPANENVVSSAPNPTSTPIRANTRKSTLESIQERGYLRCADISVPFSGFISTDPETGKKTGFYGELCNAIAAALNVEPVFRPLAGEWDSYLQQIASHDENKTVDITIIGHTITMERNVKGAVSGLQEGLSFSTPFLYDGLKFAGDEFYVTQCVDQGLKHIEECSDIRACILDFSTHFDIVDKVMPRRFFVPRNKTQLMAFSRFEGLRNGTCNVMAHESLRLIPPVARFMGVEGPYAVSQNYFSKEPLAIVTKSQDPEFSDYVDSIMQALLVAEKHNITQATADQFPQTHLFGEAYKDMYRRALNVTGNYNELYKRFLQQYLPRSSLNLLNNGSTGLLYALPFGDCENSERNLTSQPLGHLLQGILDRKHLRCGIRLGRPGFANHSNRSADSEYSGLEADLCSALAAALFHDPQAIEFVELTHSNEGFQLLANHSVDLVAGALWSMENDVKEATTGMGFSFSQPYFYGFSQDEDNLALATRQDDHDWEAIVYWTLSALIHAEEKGIQQHLCNQMPAVSLFSKELERMFKDAVLAVGNFGEIYERNLQAIHPRSGRNQLNPIEASGPQYFAIPGFFSRST